LKQNGGLMKFLKYSAEPYGPEITTANVTGRNSLFQVWLEYQLFSGVRQNQQPDFGLFVLFTRSFSGAS